MRHRNDRFSGNQIFYSFGNFLFRLVIQSRSRLIKNQYRRILQNCPGDSYALAFAARKLDAFFADHGIITVRQLPNKVISTGLLGSKADFPIGGLGIAINDILADIAVKKRILLRNNADIPMQA